MLGITDDVKMKKSKNSKRKRRNVTFNDEECIINPEDVDPNVGRFRNLIQTTVIPTKRSRIESNFMGYTPSNTSTSTTGQYIFVVQYLRLLVLSSFFLRSHSFESIGFCFEKEFFNNRTKYYRIDGKNCEKSCNMKEKTSTSEHHCLFHLIHSSGNDTWFSYSMHSFMILSVLVLHDCTAL